MPVVLYQIGNINVYNTVKGSEGSAVEVDLGRSWKSPTTAFTGVGDLHSFLQLGRSISDAANLKYKGTALTFPQQPLDSFISRLNSIGGMRNTPIIAFRYEDRDSEDCGGCVTEFDWLFNYGIVRKNDVESQYMAANNVNSFAKMQVSLDINLQTRWRRLSPWFWEYRPWDAHIMAPANPLLFQSGTDKRFTHPEKFDDLNDFAAFYRWKMDDAMLTPLFWGEKYSGLSGGYGINFSDFGAFEFYADVSQWSAPPESVYAFTGLAPVGSISMEITYAPQSGISGTQTETSSLNLAVLDADLATAGYYGLLETDVIYTGNVQPFPGFIQRDGLELSGVRPRWTYSGSFPGQAFAGYNTLKFIRTNTPGQVAFLHEYGVY